MKDPYEAQQKELLDEYADIKRVVDNCGMKDCNMCVEDKQEMKRLQGEIDRLAKIRVHHPVQPKTQVEKWREEIDRNYDAIDSCPCDIQHCTKQGTDNCEQRIIKNIELNNLISQATQPIHPRYSTGTFADDVKMCGCGEVATLGGAEVEVAGVCHRYNKPCYVYKKVTLLDKIKKLLWKYLEK